MLSEKQSSVSPSPSLDELRMVKPHGRLVQVSSRTHIPYTPCLSTL